MAALTAPNRSSESRALSGRSGLGRRLGLGVALPALIVLLGRVSAADTNAVISGWLAAQTNVQTWEADFTQTRTLKTLTKPLLATGHLRFAAPDRFRWELLAPAQTIALRDADEMWVIYPMLKRAERYRFDEKTSGEWRETLSLLEAGFPRNRAELDSRFNVVSIVETNGNWQLALQPSNAFARKLMRQITVGLATNDFALTSTELEFVDGSRMRNDFTNAVLNPKLDGTLFKWTPGVEFKVTEPLGR